MRLSRRLAITALSLVSAASLVACGGASDSTNPATPAAGAQGASAGADITGEVTVFAAASLQNAFEELAMSFQNAHPGVRIAFDVGKARIGVARCDQDAILPFPVVTLRRDR